MTRATWVLLALVVALAAFVLLWERKQPGTDEAARAEGRLLPAWAKEATGLSRSGADPVALVRTGEEWRLETPVADRTDRYAVTGFLDRLAEAEVVRWLDGAAPAELGLDPPALAWELRGPGGQLAVEVGAEAALHAGLYLRVGGRPALVAAPLGETLRRPADEFRSKELLGVASADVTALAHTVGNVERLAFRRGAEGWELTAPFPDAADGDKLERIVEDLCLCLVDRFVEEAPKDLSAYGLSPPAQEVRLSTKGGEQVVALGAPVPGGDPTHALVYAQATGRTAVVALSLNSLKTLTQDPEGLRSLAPFRHDPYAAKSLAVSGAAALQLEASEAGIWRLKAPPAGVKAEEGAALFGALAALKGRRAMISPGAPFRPALTLVLAGEGWEERVEIGVEAGGLRLLKPARRPAYLELDPQAWATAEAALAVASGKVPSPAGPEPSGPAAPEPAPAP